MPINCHRPQKLFRSLQTLQHIPNMFLTELSPFPSSPENIATSSEVSSVGNESARMSFSPFPFHFELHLATTPELIQHLLPLVSQLESVAFSQHRDTSSNENAAAAHLTAQSYKSFKLMELVNQWFSPGTL